METPSLGVCLASLAAVQELTRELWAEQDRHPGDRLRLFSAVGSAFQLSSVLYPGSFVDIAPSFVFEAVTYVDTDRRAAKFFADASGVDEIITRHRETASERAWRFIPADYTSDLDLPPQRSDLLVSLYAGFVSEHCTRYLRPGGLLLAGPSHGDAAMASIDSRYRLVAVVKARSGGYTVSEDALDSYLIPKRDVEGTSELLHRTGRGIAYTKSPFAYLFELENKR
jgi:hypothetical protein